MSWQTYVDQNLVGTGHIAQGAICGAAGEVWAESTAGFVGADEGAKVAKGFTDPSSLLGQSFHLQGEKYLTIKIADNVIYGKKGPAGVTIAKSGQAIVIGTYGDGQQPGNCNIVVEGLKDYLVSVGY
ncbi:hypothetical protein CYMTET_7137 [Cymbomonas tetramitiformis]|uniref:Profilin n=1 Tax=Cymbomonas tetramitiformis TaxID=36881 RepID=A0AAE0GW92_9CHLO|nr:hypothetical protein CYMTET_7137 [Cymbomonas tetramitiformis]|eukprot:gene13810-16320_t